MDITSRITVDIKAPRAILRDKGFLPGGDVQRFFTAEVLRRIVRYMPYRTGTTIKLTVAASPAERRYIVTDAPYAKFLYYGKVMVDPVTGAAGFRDKDGQWKSWKGRPKVKSTRNIVYTTTKNPLAGPYWDRRMMAAEGSALREAVQNYIDRRAGRL